jgi:hypothetical protein
LTKKKIFISLSILGVIAILLGLVYIFKNDNTEFRHISFDHAKWSIKEHGLYPHRKQMLDDVIYNDSIRSLDKTQILQLLGKPDRENEGHLYYMIDQKRALYFPLNTKTLVIKFNSEKHIEWMKIHG